MKLFDCNNCGQILYFENTHCENCNFPLGFSSDTMDLLTLQPIDNGHLFQDIIDQTVYRYCSNAGYNACNWLIPVNSNAVFCKACQLNRTIPNLYVPGNLQLWRKIEVAKHRLIYTLLRLNLPISENETPADHNLQFDFLCGTDEDRILTGHQNGLITFNVLEADRLIREKTRAAMGEMYRTLIGHFRHEIGHYYWVLLIERNPDNLQAFRQLFGNDQQDYQEALKRHYRNKDNQSWKGNYISQYASTHPWEDWAECWAHYLHILDTLETAYAYGMQISPQVTSDRQDYFDVAIQQDPFVGQPDINLLIDQWVPLSSAINSMNRSMGQPDIYPFYISEKVVEKLSFIHDLCQK